MGRAWCTLPTLFCLAIACGGGSNSPDVSDADDFSDADADVLDEDAGEDPGVAEDSPLQPDADGDVPSPVCGNRTVEPGEECEEGMEESCPTSCDGTGTRACIGCAWETTCHPPPEECNGVDDDCDNETDEDLGVSRCGVGACARAVDNCLAGRPNPCRPGTPSPEPWCDRLDNDCDGETDEDLFPVTCGLGACTRTTHADCDPASGSCIPGAPSPEICDGIDNDCDGRTDEDVDCECLRVRADFPGFAPCCNGATCPGTAAEPFCTIGDAMAAAAAGPVHRVCVAAEPWVTAGVCLRHEYAEAVVMADGVVLEGGYDPATWELSDACETAILNQTADGVLFPPGTSNGTVVAGFTIVGWAGVGEETSTAVTFDDSSGTVVRDEIEFADVPQAYGVVVRSSDGTHTPTISARVRSGSWSTRGEHQIGLRCLNAAPRIETFGLESFLPAGVVEFVGVWATDYPAMRIRSFESFISATSPGGSATGILAEGDLGGLVVSGLYLSLDAWGDGSDVTGVRIRACAPSSGPAYVIDDDLHLAASAEDSAANGIVIEAGCGAVVGGCFLDGMLGPMTTNSSRGIVCEAGSSCSLIRNLVETVGWAADTIGILCERDACGSVFRNTIRSRYDRSASAAGESVAMRVIGGAPWIDRCTIASGCATTSVGLDLVASAARVTNNYISPCDQSHLDGTNSADSSGVRQENDLTGVGPDVHSNTIDAGFLGTCELGRAVAVVAPPGSCPAGVYRNDILHAGTCTVRRGFDETSPSADPALLQYNLFWGATDGLYRDEDRTSVDSAEAINELSDVAAASNIVGDPRLYVWPEPDPDLLPWIDAGIDVCAPRWDFHGNPRPGGRFFDIGAAEY